ncbi:MAG: magnesium chelatase, partial [Bacteroidota bacterium]|nr:magnesium chelatase [Bacteroidota bacterium]
MSQNAPDIQTLGALRASGYTPRSISAEIRANLIDRLQSGAPLFEGIVGYDDTVLPDVQRALLAGHSMNLLGLRGQAKTRIARGLTDLLDEWVPILPGAPLPEDPLAPITEQGRALVEAGGDDTSIGWMHRSERYVEKLATPDVSVADLIGDIDPIKAANEGLDYSDPKALHYGLIPRSHRCIFAINELPDLQPRIQVALFNILQEGDIQIRGFQMRLDLDIQFVFTANPEDYTNRGAIITPLKDRIQSQILTHYPASLEDAMSITDQEATWQPGQSERVTVPNVVRRVLERIAFEARESEYIDEKSGVSARLPISALEHLVAAGELRALRNGAERTTVRVTDLLAVVPAVNGKVELVYEGEQEGAAGVALALVSKAIRREFPTIFPDLESVKRGKVEDPYQPVVAWFNRHDLTV